MKIFVLIRTNGNAYPSERDPDIYPTKEAAEKALAQKPVSYGLSVQAREIRG